MASSSVNTSIASIPRIRRAGRLLTALSGALLLATTVAASAQVNRDFGKVPLSFEPNHGQTDARVQFLSRGQGYGLFLTADQAVLQLQRSVADTHGSTLAMKLVGSNRNAASSAQDLLPGTANYFQGADKSHWQTGLSTYKRVTFSAVYPGVDLVYYGNQRQLEYDFVLAPGASPQQIALKFDGAKPAIDRATGDLVLALGGGQTRFHKPVVYQLDGSHKVPIAGAYSIANNEVHFALGSYDKARTLIIDPVLSYVTYLGGSGDDQVKGMAVDAQGNVIIVGTTLSTDYPLKNPYSSVPPFDYRTSTMFVSKFNATGTALIYSTYLGVSTQGSGIAVDPAGNAYVYATTNDPNYPVTSGAYQTICGANFNQSTGARITGCSALFVTGNNSTALSKISPYGSTLVYSTYLGGSNGNIADAIAVNAAGEAYVTGRTNFNCDHAPAYYCWPTTANAINQAGYRQGDTLMFVTKFNAQGSALLYSTVIYNQNPAGHYLSGIQPKSIAVDSTGNAYVTGYMDANYFIPTTTGAYLPNRLSTGQPGFVVKINPSAASSLAYATYLSGTLSSADYANAITVDAAGDAYVAGYTNSCTFPTTAGAFSPTPNGNDVPGNNCGGGFLSKINPSGSGLVWSTYTGNRGTKGNTNDTNNAIALGADNSVYVVADVLNVALIPTVNPILTQLESHFTALRHFTADGSQLVLSTAIGGTTDATSIPVGVFVDAANNIYLAGSTNSSTFPTTPGAVQKSSANPGINYGETYIVKIAPTATTTTALTVPTGTITAGQSVKLTAKVTGQSGVTGTPTGTVTFLSGSTTLGTGTLDGTGTATYTVPSVNGTTYTYTASYAGDTAFAASTSAPQTLVVTPATPTVALTAPATALVGASVTLAVTASGTVGTPTGTVIFRDGTTTLATSTLASGSASFSTSTLAAGPHVITASYSGDSIYAAAVSAASTVTINVNPAITFAANPTALTIVHGTSGTVTITGTPVGGYTGTSAFSCGALPAGATCTFAPSSLTFSGNNTAQSVTLTVGTVTTAALACPLAPGQSASNIFFALLVLPLGWLAGARKTRKAGRSLLLLTLLTISAGLIGLTGCSNGSFPAKATTTTTAPGSYTIAVTVANGGSTATVNVPLTVQ